MGSQQSPFVDTDPWLPSVVPKSKKFCREKKSFYKVGTKIQWVAKPDQGCEYSSIAAAVMRLSTGH